MKPISESDLEQLSAYLDGELHGSERRFFEKRLAGDPELRAYCERAWIASSLLKAQPLRLMPAASAESICARCQPEADVPRRPWRLVASVAALALALGLGYTLLPPAPGPSTGGTYAAKTPAQAASKTAADATRPVTRTLQRPMVAVQAPAAGKTAAAAPSRPAAQAATQDDPSRFALNEATLSKSWPKHDQAMDDYLVRHNRMNGSNAGSDLISYAQMLSEPESPAADSPAPDQDGQ